MPIVNPSSYKPNTSLLYKYTETISSSIFSRVDGVQYERERLELVDGDFLDLDWVKNGCRRLIILSTGMEGSSSRHYMRGTAKYFSARGWDVLAWNFRSCSGELNRLPRLYSYAETDDFTTVINHSIASGKYKKVALVGFSMGGCLVTKYLGEKPDPRIKASVVFSVSCDLKDSMRETEKKENFIYNHYFVSKLKSKLNLKAAKFKEIEELPYKKIKTFDDYLRCYTIPFHGFKDVAEFYAMSSCKQFIPNINVPSLMVNALNDPILGKNCYPYEIAKDHNYFYLETPTTGGHLGFPLKDSKHSWMAVRSFDFISSQLKEEKF